MMNEVIHQLRFNLAYATKLVEDVTPEQMTVKPGPGLDNHPAFTLGHLVTAFANLGNNITGEFVLAEGYKALFLRTGPGDPTLPDTDAAHYPSKENLLSELSSQTERIIGIISNLDEKKLSEKFEWRFSSFCPTYRDRIIFLCVNHYAMHLGQLAAWRRAMGLTSALGALK